MTVVINGTSGITDVNGSAAAPAITGTDTDTGVFFGTNTVSLSTGGTERLQVDTSGNLGLGVTPSAWGSGLKAIELGGSNSYLALNNTAASGYVYWNMWNDGTNNKTKQTGFIGAYGLNTSGGHVWFNGSGTAGTTSSLTQAMTLDADGDLGIGETSPASKLHITASTAPSSNSILRIDNTATTNYSGTSYVGGQIRLNYTNATSRYGGINFSNTGATSQEFFGVVQNSSGYGDFVWQGYGAAGYTERARIDSSGNLLVGTTSGTQRLVVSKNDSGAYVAYFENTTGSNANGVLISTPNRAGNAGLYGLTVANSGGNAFAIYTNGTYGTISDINRKKNVETARDGYLTDLCALRVVKYNWNEQEDGEPKEIGFIAQEIEQVFAGLVQTDDNGQKLVKQPVLIPMLVKAIQEQQAIITQLQADVAALKAKA